MNYKILIADDKGDSFEYLQEILKDEIDKYIREFNSILGDTLNNLKDNK